MPWKPAPTLWCLLELKEGCHGFIHGRLTSVAWAWPCPGVVARVSLFREPQKLLAEVTDAWEASPFPIIKAPPALGAEAMCLRSRLSPFQPQDSFKLPFPHARRWTPIMRRTLLLAECGARGSSLGFPVKVHREGGASLSASLSSHLGDL